MAVAKATADRLMSISEILAKKERVEINDEEGVGLVVPVHYGNLPVPASELLRRVKEGRVNISTPYFFVVATYGEVAGRACSHIMKAASDAGLKPDYLRSIKMVDNNFSVVSVDRQIKSQGKKNIPGHIKEIAGDIASRKRMIETPGVFNRIAGVCMDIIGADTKAYKKFYVETEKCNACGVCTQVCPIGNISIVDGTPQWGEACIKCTSCYHNCSHAAIRFKGEKSRVQFRNPAVSLKEIIKANSGKE